MADLTGSSPKAPRVRIRFLAAAPAARSDDDDPLLVAANAQYSWRLQVTEVGQPAPLGEWGLWHPMDLFSAETIKLLSIEREMAGLSSDGYLIRIREQIQLLVPDLPTEVFDRLTAQQILAIGLKAWQRPGETKKESAVREADAANPPVGERDLASSSRSPAGSLDGVIPS